MDKFRDLMPKFAEFYSRILPLVNSGELVLPFGPLNRKEAKMFKKKLMQFPEFVDLLKAMTRNESFRKYFDKVGPLFDSWDWRDQDADHLKNINWFAVEVIRTLLEDAFVLKEDPLKVFPILSDYIDKGSIDAPLNIHFRSNLKIEMDSYEENLDDMVKLQCGGGEKDMFEYVLKTHFTVKFSNDYTEVANFEKLRHEVYRVLGKFILSLILMNVSIRFFRLKIIGVETYYYLLWYPSMWPTVAWGLVLKSDPKSFSIPAIFIESPPPPPPESGLVLDLARDLPPHFKYSMLHVQFVALKTIWNQLNELAAKVKGLDQRIIVIGKRFYQMNVSDMEDVLLAFCILLESLVFKTDDHDGLSHKFALRASLLATTKPDEISKSFDWFREVYRIRSKILHGKTIGELEKGEIESFFSKIPFGGIAFVSEMPALVFSWRIIKRLFTLLFIKPDIKNYDELIDFLDSAILNPQLREEIYKIELQ